MRFDHAGSEHDEKKLKNCCLCWLQANAYFDSLFDFAVRNASLSPPVRILPPEIRVGVLGRLKKVLCNS
jgi:hypothetical protein